MRRYRPPAAKRSPYITAEGYAALDQELKQRWQQRSEVIKALTAAAAEGDRSENAEYIYRKKELREIDRRIRYLQKRLPELTIVTQQPANTSRVYFGAWVSVENQSGQEFCYRIVGLDELKGSPEYISVDSPLARALLGQASDNKITVPTPKGPAYYIITEIRYGAVPK
ncbi:MAG: transcription elongation factor GreB [Gammaproteobacteria bacterium]|nr:transcription elongation factor GreB [Gammaproteobacteria bacterium]